MGNGAVQMRRQAAKEKKQAAKEKKQAAKGPLITPAASQSPVSPLASPPASPHTAAHEIPETGARIDVTTAKRQPATKERKRRLVVTSDRVTRFRGATNNLSQSVDATYNATGGRIREKSIPMPSQPHVTLPGEGNDTSDERRPVRQSSVAIRTLLQQISSQPDIEEDLPANSTEEDETEGGDNKEDNEKDYSEGNNDSDDEAVEIMAPKVVKARKKPVIMMQEDESEDNNNEKGGSDRLGNDDNDNEAVKIVAQKKVGKARKKPAQVVTMQEDRSEDEDDDDDDGESENLL